MRKESMGIIILVLLFVLLFAGVYKWRNSYEINDSISFEMNTSEKAMPFMGFAPRADNEEAAEDCSLVYIDITFKELQPESSDSFDFRGIEEENNIRRWKEEGKHAVLRFLCDVPDDEEHSDIPPWLMEMTGDGTFYDISYGKGYSPNYSNETFICYHKKAVAALAEYFDDGFVSYVELGSLGHWGEWHVKEGEGIVPIPEESVRDEYVSHYTEYFKNAKLLMRRPFRVSEEKNLGLYNDMIGVREDTQEWLDWINNGGEYSPSGEKNALVPMPEYWKKAPSGGEISSSASMESICRENLDETLEMLSQSHTTFIGPKIPGEEYSSEREQILSSVGYRIGITQVSLKKKNGENDVTVTLKWENKGVAPIYFDLPVKLYSQEEESFKEIGDVKIKLSGLLPGTAETVSVKIPEEEIKEKTLCIGVIDPMTKRAVNIFSTEHEERDGYILIYG